MRLLLYFVLSVATIVSLVEWDITIVIPRLFVGSFIIGVVWVINTYFILYFEKRKKEQNDRVQTKVFFAALPITYLFILCYHFSVEYLRNNGVPIPALYEKELLTNKEQLLRALVGGLGLQYFVFLVQSFSFTLHEKIRMENEVFQLKAVNTETTNQLLQQQIQPHFLFNTLNVLKSLIKKNPENAEKYLLRLSDFLRVSVSGNKAGVATVDDELKLCNDYMDMQLIRFGNALNYKVEICDDPEMLKRKLPFFSLQPLLENAIKHNTLTEDKPLKIVIRSNDNKYIIVSNNLQPKNIVEFSTGNGLYNLQERYRLISGDKIFIEKNDKEFKVSLKVI